ncbi:MAG: orotate phosphoribosyltransferase [Defluviitaleaceae bacterium]|nr:orotate phosphoribosyltransferase [Defluviitaleaceae bacterium]
MKETVAKHLLDIKAVILRPEAPFTWTSGMKSPIYCDNRLTLSYPLVRKDIETGLCDMVRKSYPETEMLMGTATAGIPHAAIMAHQLDLPMGYVRSSSKKHGRGNQVEGLTEKGMKVLVVEDLISTGKSSIEAVEVLRELGCEVLGIISIFSYELEKGLANLKAANVKHDALCNYDTLIQIAAETGYITEAAVAKLVAWRKNPTDESWIG